MKDYQFELIFGVLLYIAARQSTGGIAEYLLGVSVAFCVGGVINTWVHYTKKWWRK